MELIFVRHGEPAWGIGGVSQPDPHLTELGLRQARLTAERLASASRHATEIVVSPRRRAQETAAPLSELSGITPETIADLEEIRMPDWSGEPEEKVQQIFAEARLRPADEWWDGLPGGESFNDFHDRVARVMLDLLSARGVEPVGPGQPHMWNVAHEDQRIIVVAHAGTNSTALSFLLGIEPTPWEWERFILGHASLARLRAIPLAGSNVLSLRAFNDRDHLPVDLRTR